jgi:hypothetical protein
MSRKSMVELVVKRASAYELGRVGWVLQKI